MQVLINKAEASIQPEENELLGQLFSRLEDHFNKYNQAAITITLDGEQLTAEKQAESSSQQTSNFTTLEIEAIDFKQLPIHTLEEFKPLLKETAPITEKIAEQLQAGNSEEALKQIDPVLQVWAMLFQTLSDASHLLKFKLSEIKHEDSTVENLVNSLSSQLKDIQVAMGNQDYVTVADVFEYEIGPACDVWLATLDLIIDHIKNILANEPAGQ